MDENTDNLCIQNAKDQIKRVTTLVSRISALVYNHISCFNYLTFDLALAQTIEKSERVTSKVNIIARGGLGR